ncbi:MAG: amino acid permease, partial [Halobacteriaceae archaeon]
RPVLSVAVVAAFITVNLLGVRESGLIEDLLVAVKLVIVAAFAVFGTAAALGELEFGVAQTVTNPVGPVVAAGIAFVSFEGWQLLFYDQDAIADVESTLPRAVYLSVPVATLAYVAVAFVTVNLVPIETVIAHPDLALAEAAAVVAGRVGYVAVGVAAVASTASAINATLFSTALFADHLGRDDLLPTEGSTGSGVPTRALLVIGVVTMAFTAVGSLTAITEFASLAFIVVFGVVDAIAVMHRSQIPVRPGVAGLGLVGTAAFLPVFVWHLYTAEPRVFQAVATIAVVLGVVEGLYFKRSAASEGLAGIRKRL